MAIAQVEIGELHDDFNVARLRWDCLPIGAGIDKACRPPKKDG